MSNHQVVRIDSLELLRPLFGKLPEALFDGSEHAYSLAQISTIQLGWDVTSWWGSVRWLFTWMVAATPGMLLSGLAASAGSSFWHDQLDRLRAAKIEDTDLRHSFLENVAAHREIVAEWIAQKENAP